jgi:hypothetical protein
MVNVALEIWLDWDHKTARERGRDALLRFRLDFLLLLPQLGSYATNRRS